MLPRILFDTAGGRHGEYSTGHLSRCLQVCQKISSENSSAQFRFVLPYDQSGVEILRKAGHKPSIYRGIKNQKRIVQDIFSSWNPDIVVIDRLDCPVEYVRWLKKFGKVVVSVDDSTSSASLADVSINALIPNRRSQHQGYSYLILSEEKAKRPLFSNKAHHCLVSFGGYEPANLTLRFLQTLSQESWAQQIHFHVFAGIGISNQALIQKTLKKFGKHSHLYPYSPKFFKIMGKADTVITGGGLTMFEASKRGAVTGVFELRDHQKYNIQKMAKQNLIAPLGTWQNVETKKVIHGLRVFFEGSNFRKKLVSNSAAFWKKTKSETTYERLLQVATLDPVNKRQVRLWVSKPTQAVLNYTLRYCMHHQFKNPKIKGRIL